MATILIADDASFMRNSLQFLVELAGHKVVAQAKNGLDALQLYKQHKPDLVLLDILMEEMDGLSALRQLMKEDPKPRVIVVSALGHKEPREEAHQLGARGFVAKPFSQEAVSAEISRVLAEKE